MLRLLEKAGDQSPLKKSGERSEFVERSEKLNRRAKRGRQATQEYIKQLTDENKHENVELIDKAQRIHTQGDQSPLKKRW